MPWYPDEVQRLVALEERLSTSWTHLRAQRRSVGCCLVTVVDLPPEAVAELGELLALVEEDADLDVLVFVLAGDDRPVEWGDVLVRLEQARPVTVAALRGGAGGAGRELALACDVRVASRAGLGLAVDRLVPEEALDDAVDTLVLRLADVEPEAIVRDKPAVVRRVLASFTDP